MIIVSDTSVICNLFLVGHLDLLPKLFQNIIIPPKVHEELLELQRFNYDISTIINADFITIQVPSDNVFIQQLLQDIDAGEAEAIALAIELNATVLLIDEMKGRTIATNFGLDITGILGILLKAKVDGHIPVIRPVLDDLRNRAKFYVGEKLYKLVLKKAQE